KNTSFRKKQSHSDDEEDYEERKVSQKPKSSKPRISQRTAKVVPMRTSKNSGMEVCVIKPNSMDDARELCETLLANRAVVLNLEGVHIEIAQRIVDFTSGACFAIDGNFQKISNYIYIVTPSSVDISGDFQELFANGFGTGSSYTSKY
ncbi:MAG: cell division protein SepF, partial [Eubacterium sp.]